MEKIFQNRDPSTDSSDSIGPVTGRVHYLHNGFIKKSMLRDTNDKDEMEKNPRTVSILKEDLKNSVPVMKRFGINRSDIARFGLSRLNKRIMKIIPKELVVKDYLWSTEECSIRYSKHDGEVADFLGNAFACQFSVLGRCGYHVGVEILTAKMKEEEMNEAKFSRIFEDELKADSSIIDCDRIQAEKNEVPRRPQRPIIEAP